MICAVCRSPLPDRPYLVAPGVRVCTARCAVHWEDVHGDYDDDALDPWDGDARPYHDGTWRHDDE